MCGVNRVLFASQLRHGLLDHDNALLFDPCFHVGKFQATVIIPETTPFTLKQKYGTTGTPVRVKIIRYTRTQYYLGGSIFR